MKALRTSSPPVRLQIQIHGESVEEEDPLPVLSLCAELVEVLGDSQFANMHFFFDDAHAARAWQQLAPAAAACTRSSVLCEATGEPAQRLQDDALLVLVAPCNRRREVAGQPGLELSGAAGRAEREAAKAAKLESVQRLVCGAQQVPIVLVNPDLEALLVTQRIGKATPPPMFMSDFEHAFFLAEADAVELHLKVESRARHDSEHQGVKAHIAEVTAFCKDKHVIHCAATCDNMYASLDELTDTLSRKLRKYKERKNDVRQERRRESKQGMRDDFEDEDEDEFVQPAPAPAAAATARPRGSAPSDEPVRRKSFPMPPITVADAIVCLDYIDHDFYVFRNSQTDEVNVVYKRTSGGVGLIEPERD